jgi:hypothetical protein
MPREVLSQEQVERLQEEHKILLECVKQYADKSQGLGEECSVCGTIEGHVVKAEEALQKIKELK